MIPFQLAMHGLPECVAFVLDSDGLQCVVGIMFHQATSLFAFGSGSVPCFAEVRWHCLAVRGMRNDDGEPDENSAEWQDGFHYAVGCYIEEHELYRTWPQEQRWQNTMEEIQQELRELQQQWGQSFLARARNEANTQINEEQAAVWKSMCTEDEQRQARFQAKHGQAEPRFKCSSKRSQSEPPITLGNSGSCTNRYRTTPREMY